MYSLAARNVFIPSLGVAHPKHGSPSRASLVVAGINGVLVVLGVIASLDPVTEFYTWLGGVTSLGFMALMTLTCLSVLVYFRRNKIRASVWRTLVAPLLGIVGLLACLGAILANILPLVGGSATMAAVVVSVVLSFITGPIAAKFRGSSGIE